MREMNFAWLEKPMRESESLHMTKTTRRKFLKTALTGAAGAGVATAIPARADDYITPAMTTPGKPFSGYGMPSPHEADVKRLLRPPGISPGTGGSDTPLEHL